MATLLTSFYSYQDALTLFFDYQNDMPRDLIDAVFQQNEYLYFDASNSAMAGVQLFEYIRNKIDKYEISFPGTNRMVFCHYLRLNDLTQEWINNWKKQTLSFQERMHPQNPSDQFHVFCFVYEASSSPITSNRKETVAELLKLLQMELPDILHVSYLLYTDSFDKPVRQQQGMIRNMYILSRKSTSSMISMTWKPNCLKTITYADYSLVQAEQCVIKIETIKKWLEKEADPKLLTFISVIRDEFRGHVAKLAQAQLDFNDKVGIYPVSVEDFEKTGFWGRDRVSRFDIDHPVIQKRKEEFFEELRETLLRKYNFEGIRKLLDEKLNYKDLLLAKELAGIKSENDGSLEQELFSYVKTTVQIPEDIVYPLIEKICIRIRSHIKEVTDDLNRIHRERLLQLQRLENRFKTLGRYSGIEECFQKINNETSFKPISGQTPGSITSVCIIGKTPYEEWQANQYEISGVLQAYYCDALGDIDVLLLKIGNLIDLAEDDAIDTLKYIL